MIKESSICLKYTKYWMYLLMYLFLIPMVLNLELFPCFSRSNCDLVSAISTGVHLHFYMLCVQIFCKKHHLSLRENEEKLTNTLSLVSVANCVIYVPHSPRASISSISTLHLGYHWQPCVKTYWCWGINATVFDTLLPSQYLDNPWWRTGTSYIYLVGQYLRQFEILSYSSLEYLPKIV